mmetsp:Transcript_90911/g.157307  ORF Transcript_90911/g.157307 Transcript_90911/m.157307 type:complete len:81 (+) Transcript_90911:3-245(+)
MRHSHTSTFYSDAQSISKFSNSEEVAVGLTHMMPSIVVDSRRRQDATFHPWRISCGIDIMLVHSRNAFTLVANKKPHLGL